jgi:hypothetical protein
MSADDIGYKWQRNKIGESSNDNACVLDQTPVMTHSNEFNKQNNK